MSIAPFESDFAHSIYSQRYKHPQDRNWSGTSARVAGAVMGALRPTLRFQQSDVTAATERIYSLFNDRLAMPGGRYLYAAGRDLHQVNNCILLRCDDSREGWAELSYKAEMALMTGAGIGVYYGDVRPGGSRIERTGGVASGPLPKMSQINETGRHTMQGGNRRSAIWAGLPWYHPDIFEFMKAKDWSDEVKGLKAKDWNFPATMDMTNVSVCLDDAFFAAMRGDLPTCEALLREQAPEWLLASPEGVALSPHGDDWRMWAKDVYAAAVEHMLKHGEPGFSVDTGARWNEKLRNACTEITSEDDSDVCNLGSLVLSRFRSPMEFGQAVRDLVLFLTAGSVYSDVPYDEVGEVRERNRRLGAGLIGVHEAVMKAGALYGSDDAFEALEPYMAEYGRALEYAHEVQDRLGLSLSKGASAIAPNGTIGIVAESTPSADPLFSAAEVREVTVAHHSGLNKFERHVIIDPTAKRLMAEGVFPELIEDAYTLSMFPERRLAMTRYLQQYTDHAISGTVNLPNVMTDAADVRWFGDLLLGYLPDVRGITVYPDGARAGQPRTHVDLQWALEQKDAVLASEEAICAGGASACGV